MLIDRGRTMKTPSRRIKNIRRTCVICNREFLTSLHTIESRENGGTCCSFSCVAKRKHEEWKQTGHFNPNYKGKLALTNYEHKLNFQERYPEKALAHKIFQEAIRSGKLQRLPCSICGAPKAEGHHPDYSKPLEVIWLCDKHHKEV